MLTRAIAIFFLLFSTISNNSLISNENIFEVIDSFETPVHCRIRYVLIQNLDFQKYNVYSIIIWGRKKVCFSANEIVEKYKDKIVDLEFAKVVFPHLNLNEVNYGF